MNPSNPGRPLPSPEHANYPLPAPEEWDFRTVPESQLQTAIDYEYARSSPWVVHEFEEGHKKKVRVPGKPASTPTVAEVIRRSESEPIDCGLGQALIDSMPPSFDDRNLFSFFQISPLFPQPFVLLPQRAEDVPSASPNDLALWEVRLDDPRHARVVIENGRIQRVHWIPPVKWLLNRRGDPNDAERAVKVFHLAIDLGFKKTVIKEALWKWLKGVDDSGVKKLRFKTGRAARPPWHRLKELAAYRLAERGANYKAVCAIVSDRKKSSPTPTDPKNRVLPLYEAPSGFCTAVKNARDYLNQRFQTPS